MIYLKSVLFGVGGAVLSAVLWVIVAFVLPILVQYASVRLRRNAGIGAVGGSIDSISILIAALIGFIIAFVYGLRSSR
jgi:hypothetical protein